MALGLFLLVVAVYVPLLSGHTSSRDEETAFYAAGSLMEGQLTRVSDRLRVVQVSYGVGGEPYSRYGLGISAMTVPLLKAGQLVASLYPEQFRYFFERTFALATNALVTAATAAALCLLAQMLGYGPKTGLWLGSIYAFGTFAFPHGRTLFSEPGAALGLVLSLLLCVTWAHRHPQSAVLLPVSGLLAGLAVVVKIHAVLALPWIALYVAISAARLRYGPAGILGRVALWALGGLPALALFVSYNLAAFGGPFRTGYSGEAGPLVPNVFATGLEGLVGLTVSPGKGLWVYAPPVLVGLACLPWFSRRHPAVAVASTGIWATALAFFSSVQFWHGDAAWGPRYMAMVLPFLVLPAAEALASKLWWPKTALALLAASGAVVQLLGTLVAFATYINAETNQQARYFQPLYTPVIGHARILAARWTEWYRWLFVRQRAVVVGNGFLNTAETQIDALPRPMEREAFLDLNGVVAGKVNVSLLLQLPNSYSSPVAIWLDGAPVSGEYRWVDNGRLEERFALEATKARHTVKIESPGLAKVGDPASTVVLQEASVRDAGGTLPVVKQIYIPPWPANLYGRWNWFFDPTIHHPVDSWLWYGSAMGAFKGSGWLVPAMALGASAGLLAIGLRLISQAASRPVV